MLVLPWLLAATASGRSDPPEDVVTAGNYSVLLRHGSEADCPCFRIPCLVTTHDTPTAATLVLLVEARWDSSECYPIQGSGPGGWPRAGPRRAGPEARVQLVMHVTT